MLHVGHLIVFINKIIIFGFTTDRTHEPCVPTTKNKQKNLHSNVGTLGSSVRNHTIIGPTKKHEPKRTPTR